ncbi:MAG: hypothetical protein HXX81_03310, partial [Campylobacterales bacterium]|nr:hypothetical protein [Campylobacterales bacterium]
MGSTMTLSKKISFGFGLILFIMLVLGGIATVNMISSKNSSEKLANMYVPEVEMSVNLETTYSNIIFEMRGYNQTLDDKYLQNCLSHVEKAKVQIKQIDELSIKYPQLVKLKELMIPLKDNFSNYEKAVHELEVVIKNVKDAEKILLDAGNVYVNVAQEFLDSQVVAMDKDIQEGKSADKLNERSIKIELMSQMIIIGYNIRLNRLVASNNQDMKLMKSLLPKFDDIKTRLEKIRKITFAELNIKQLNQIEKSANDYSNSVKNYIDNFEAMNKINEKRREAQTKFFEAVKTVSVAGMTAVKANSVESASDLSAASTTVIIGLILAMIIGIIAAIFITRSITRPIIASVESIAEANTQVVSASDQISSASQNLADSVAQQASSVEEISA